ncbi:Aldo/keto reductase [Xylariaceae sp. FL0016]|nr:Aldo/keto reductase [Xylariaceae sp. FL0016]
MPTESKPRIILGLMVIGPEGTSARLTSMDDFKKSFDIFQDRGYNEIDTARLYVGGKQEGFTREAGWKERGFSIATKVFPIPPVSHDPEVLKSTFETSLKELGTDSVDDRSIPYDQTLAAVNDLYKAGKFKRLGLSNYSASEVAEIVMHCKYNNYVRPTVYQAIYNCLFRTIETELVPTCRRYGIAIDAWSPLGGGFIAGTIKSKTDNPTTGRYAPGPMEHVTRGKYFRDGIIEGAQMIREASEKAGVHPLEVAMRWLVHHSMLKIRNGDDGIVIGWSNLQQLTDNLDYAEKGPLPDDLVEVLERAWRASKADVDPYFIQPMEYKYDPQKVLFGGKA